MRHAVCAKYNLNLYSISILRYFSLRRHLLTA